MGLIAGNELIDKAQAKTFGGNLQQIAKAGLLNKNIAARLTNILDERNWLVHKSRASNRSAIYSDSVMQPLIVRLDSIANESNSLLREVASLVEDFVKQHGVSQEYLAKQSKQILQEWHSSDSL
jgi:uncharacterized protein YutE (UPF0331/DUF86 family)